jgi:hypothetical protein
MLSNSHNSTPIDTTMVAFLRSFLLLSSLPTAVHSFYTIKTNERRSLHPLSVRNDFEHCQTSSTTENAPLFSVVSRSAFLYNMIAATSAVIILPSDKVSAFVGGVGGLGKTKPETGVELFGSTPIQNDKGIISAEIQVNETPVRIAFQTPWPLLGTTQGLEARGLQNPESAFVQVVSGISKLPSDGKEFRSILLESVLSQKGKFGAYGTPMDVRVRATEGDPSLYSVRFLTLTPGEIETERQILVKAVPIRAASSLVLLVVGTTRLRYPKQKEALQRVVDSFEAVPAPATKLR